MDNLEKVDERIRKKLLYETYKDMRCPIVNQILASGINKFISKKIRSLKQKGGVK